MLWLLICHLLLTWRWLLLLLLLLRLVLIDFLRFKRVVIEIEGKVLKLGSGVVGREWRLMVMAVVMLVAMLVVAEMIVALMVSVL